MFKKDVGGWFVLASANQVFFNVCCLEMCLPWLIFIFWLSFRMLQDDLQLSDSEESGDDQVSFRCFIH